MVCGDGTTTHREQEVVKAEKQAKLMEERLKNELLTNLKMREEVRSSSSSSTIDLFSHHS